MIIRQQLALDLQSKWRNFWEFLLKGLGVRGRGSVGGEKGMWNEPRGDWASGVCKPFYSGDQGLAFHGVSILFASRICLSFV